MQHIHVKDSLDSSSQKLLDSSSPSMKKPASMGSTQEHMRKDLPGTALGDSLQQKLLDSSSKVAE
jgi:hypothetical protein